MEAAHSKSAPKINLIKFSLCSLFIVFGSQILSCQGVPPGILDKRYLSSGLNNATTAKVISGHQRLHSRELVQISAFEHKKLLFMPSYLAGYHNYRKRTKKLSGISKRENGQYRPHLAGPESQFAAELVGNGFHGGLNILQFLSLSQFEVSAPSGL